MIIDSKGNVYSKIEFKDEEEVENVVLKNFTLLFGDYSILLPKSKISTSAGKATIPDGIIIDFQESKWYILEVERGIHGTFEHIAPQITKQITAIMNAETKSKIIDMCLKEVNAKPAFKDLIAEIEIAEINLHGRLIEILKKPPYIALPIDLIPSDLYDWVKTLRNEVIVWRIEKYSDLKGNVLFSIPEVERDVIEEEDDGKLERTIKDSSGTLITKVVKAGFLTEGGEVYFDYAPKGQSKKKFIGIVRRDGIEVDGIVSSPSISSLRCIQKMNPTRTTSNGWVVWKTADGQLINEAWKKWLESEARVGTV